MLFKYRNDYEKIVMGMLSLSKSSDKTKHLLEEMNWYRNADNRDIYLWKDQFGNWAGIVGIETNPKNVVVRRITMTPDADTIFNEFRILDSVENEYPDQKIMGTFNTQDVISKWELSHEQRQSTNSLR
ncbi:hypothetical protein [Fructilactobacillus fructivorans]|uniref:Riboflavin biosynthesis protein RibT n=1 Tax=Fructilactobacillus fructivorans TaxID=1614 RepID=A0AAE6TWA3_9LACO|nr:hypothetical protein [Fructilactobacillus fructivorans]KRK58681.1 riboflavin biosynthesis acetyltransferase RibT [Fructilactobacillus fructivorans]KRN13591.1 riboflavin biosynthesis acetyltransferase RibT [Fructilactobacillus fructivorans]KRN40235.1 riboflavin biosynthesis acetyltransferase RibT [Fructilactobacillus fructivorans]KRN43432.1 riboflavin biosynthesis acetyltransferase RibT [Fructilactobacillus fructivorans]QFX92684.1 riboflavin biosynthesis protein RibT [Fructilactobacillus fru